MASTDDYAVLVAIIETGSMTAAAKKTGRSVQSVSRLLANLEKELGALLVRRTTRSLNPTRAGLNFVRRIQNVLQELEFAKDELREESSQVAGEVRLSASTLFGPLYVLPMVARFMALYPKVQVTMNISDEFLSLDASGVDLAIRISELRDSALKARLLGYSRRIVIASPEYLARNGTPKHPVDLRRHSCIVRTSANEASAWRFRSKGATEWVEVQGPLKTDNASIVNQAVLYGLGIGVAQMWQVRELVEQRRISVLLTDYELPPVPVNVVWLPHRQMAPRVRRLIDFFEGNMKANLN
jgi:DNA-binding transcriptional LysR family regulator